MAGPQTPVIKGNKQYGDAKALDSLKRQATGLQYDNASTLPQERRGVGRPAGPTAGQAIPQAQPEAPGIPPEHVAMIEDFARATFVAQTGSRAAQDPMAGPWLRSYAQFAEQEVIAKGERVRASTPFYDTEE